MKKSLIMLVCIFHIFTIKADYTSQLQCAELYQFDIHDQALIIKILNENDQRKGLHKLIKKLDQDSAYIEGLCKQKSLNIIHNSHELIMLKRKIVDIKNMIRATRHYQDERAFAFLARWFLM